MRVWFACAFENSGDELLHHWVPAHGLSLELIREVWSLPSNDPVYGAGYEITAENVHRVQPFVSETMDLAAFTWQLSDEAEGDEPG